LTQEDFHPYDIKYDNWKTRSSNEGYTPSLDTINSMLTVLIQYNHPKYPIQALTPKTRGPPATFLMLAPARHGPRNLSVHRRPNDFGECTNETVYYL